jgi:hypothetical protein
MLSRASLQCYYIFLVLGVIDLSTLLLGVENDMSLKPVLRGVMDVTHFQYP